MKETRDKNTSITFPLEASRLYHQLGYDWDAKLNDLDGEDLWDTPNYNSRRVRRMVVTECLRTADAIKRLPFWRRLFNLF